MADLGIPLLPTDEVALGVIIAGCPSVDAMTDGGAANCVSPTMPEETGVAGALTLPRAEPSPFRHQVSSSKTFSKQS